MKFETNSDKKYPKYQYFLFNGDFRSPKAEFHELDCSRKISNWIKKDLPSKVLIGSVHHAFSQGFVNF